MTEVISMSSFFKKKQILILSQKSVLILCASNTLFIEPRHAGSFLPERAAFENTFLNLFLNKLILKNEYMVRKILLKDKIFLLVIIQIHWEKAQTLAPIFRGHLTRIGHPGEYTLHVINIRGKLSVIGRCSCHRRK